MTGLAAAGGYLVCRKLRGADGRFLPERSLEGRLAPAEVPEPVPQPAKIAPGMGEAEVGSNLLMTGGAIEKQVVNQVIASRHAADGALRTSSGAQPQAVAGAAAPAGSAGGGEEGAGEGILPAFPGRLMADQRNEWSCKKQRPADFPQAFDDRLKAGTIYLRRRL